MKSQVQRNLLLIALLAFQMLMSTRQALAQTAPQSLEDMRKAAEQGDSTSQFNLGYRYEMGRGVDEDYAEALKWYRKAAAQNVELAWYAIGHLYESGLGVPNDEVEATLWYRRAADQGLGIAQANLAARYRVGRGVKMDFQEAYKWFTLAISNVPEELRKPVEQFRDEAAAQMTAAQIAEGQRLAREWKPSQPK